MCAMIISLSFRHWFDEKITARATVIPTIISAADGRFTIFVALEGQYVYEKLLNLYYNQEPYEIFYFARAQLAGLFFVANDAFNGFVLLVIGLVYLKGVDSVMSGEHEGLSYVSVGALMSTVLLALYAVNIVSNGLGLVLGFEDWLGWTVWGDFRPGLILWVLALPAVLVALKKEWRD